MSIVTWAASLLSIYLSFRFAEAMRKEEPLRSQVPTIIIVVVLIAWVMSSEVRGASAP